MQLSQHEVSGAFAGSTQKCQYPKPPLDVWVFLVLFLSHNRKLAQEAWLSHPLKAMWVEGLCLATSWGRWLGIADSSLFKGDIKGHYMQLPIGYQNSLCKIPMSRNLCFNLSEDWELTASHWGSSFVNVSISPLLAFSHSETSALLIGWDLRVRLCHGQKGSEG